MKNVKGGNGLQAITHEMADDLWREGEEVPTAGILPRPEGESAVDLARWVTRAMGSALLEKHVDPDGLSTRVYQVSGPSGARWYVDVNFPEFLGPSLWGFVREKVGERNFSGTVYEGKVSFQFYPLGGAGNTAVAHF